MMTLESTAIPIVKMIPAIPGSERLILVTESTIAKIAAYAMRDMHDTTPGTLYMRII